MGVFNEFSLKFKVTTASTGSFRNDESVYIWHPDDNLTFVDTFSIYLGLKFLLT